MENAAPGGGQVVQRTVEETRVTPPPDDPRVAQALEASQAATQIAASAAADAAATRDAVTALSASQQKTEEQLARLSQMTASAIDSAARASTQATNSSIPDGGEPPTAQTLTQQDDVVLPVEPMDDTPTSGAPEGEPERPTPFWKKVLLGE